MNIYVSLWYIFSNVIWKNSGYLNVKQVFFLNSEPCVNLAGDQFYDYDICTSATEVDCLDPRIRLNCASQCNACGMTFSTVPNWFQTFHFEITICVTFLEL